MPKWTEYTTKDTLADNDEVMLYDATGKANKRGLMSKFWDYVVDKMATAVISKLETNNKTIIGAINALNSDSKFTKVGYTGENNEAIIDLSGYSEGAYEFISPTGAYCVIGKSGGNWLVTAKTYETTAVSGNSLTIGCGSWYSTVFMRKIISL